MDPERSEAFPDGISRPDRVVSLNVVYESALVTGHAGGVGPAVMPALPVD